MPSSVVVVFNKYQHLPQTQEVLKGSFCYIILPAVCSFNPIPELNSPNVSIQILQVATDRAQSY